MTSATDSSVSPAAGPEREQPQSRRGLYIGLGVGAVVLLALAVLAVVGLVRNPATTETIRDIFIILMALEVLIVGVALVVLIVQVAVLTNVLKHEIRPILDSTQEAARTLRGTATFVSQNLVEPVIKVQATAAAVRSALDVFRPNNK